MFFRLSNRGGICILYLCRTGCAVRAWTRHDTLWFAVSDEEELCPEKKTNLTMPVLALRGLMVFPHMVLHFDVGRPKSVAALQEAMMNDQKIFLVAQKDVDDRRPYPGKFVHRSAQSPIFGRC